MAEVKRADMEQLHLPRSDESERFLHRLNIVASHACDLGLCPPAVVPMLSKINDTQNTRGTVLQIKIQTRTPQRSKHREINKT